MLRPIYSNSVLSTCGRHPRNPHPRCRRPRGSYSSPHGEKTDWRAGICPVLVDCKRSEQSLPTVASKAPTQAATRASVILASVIAGFLGYEMRISAEVIVLAMKLSQEVERDERRERRGEREVDRAVKWRGHQRPLRSGSCEP